MNTYKFVIHGICPHSGETNYYQVMVRSHDTIRCEDILEAANELRGSKLIQEDLNAALSDKIPGAVTMAGMHCGIELESSR